MVMVATNAVITWRDRHIPVKIRSEYHRGESHSDARLSILLSIVAEKKNVTV